MKHPIKDLPKRNHLAILKKSWRMIEKILNGTKTCESRWYKSKIAPWNRIHPGDNLYFKNSGEPVIIKTKVTKVLQYEVKNNHHALEIMKRHTKPVLGLEMIPQEIENYLLNKKYAIFIFFNSVEKIKPLPIDKTELGLQTAWVTVDDINRITKQSIRLR